MTMVDRFIHYINHLVEELDNLTILENKNAEALALIDYEIERVNERFARELVKADTLPEKDALEYRELTLEAKDREIEELLKKPANKMTIVDFNRLKDVKTNLLLNVLRAERKYISLKSKEYFKELMDKNLINRLSEEELIQYEIEHYMVGDKAKIRANTYDIPYVIVDGDDIVDYHLVALADSASIYEINVKEELKKKS